MKNKNTFLFITNFGKTEIRIRKVLEYNKINVLILV
jgi:hypothetical protein